MCSLVTAPSIKATSASTQRLATSTSHNMLCLTKMFFHSLNLHYFMMIAPLKGSFARFQPGKIPLPLQFRTLAETKNPLKRGGVPLASRLAVTDSLPHDLHLSSLNIDSPTQDAPYLSHGIQPIFSNEHDASIQALLDNNMSSPFISDHEPTRVSSPAA